MQDISAVRAEAYSGVRGGGVAEGDRAGAFQPAPGRRDAGGRIWQAVVAHGAAQRQRVRAAGDPAEAGVHDGRLVAIRAGDDDGRRAGVAQAAVVHDAERRGKAASPRVSMRRSRPAAEIVIAEIPVVSRDRAVRISRTAAIEHDAARHGTGGGRNRKLCDRRGPSAERRADGDDTRHRAGEAVVVGDGERGGVSAGHGVSVAEQVRALGAGAVAEVPREFPNRSGGIGRGATVERHRQIHEAVG